ncbi:phage protease [Rhodococcus erythropolis]|uniref:phage protease n=2 Tax=Actinomycetes TaxID=1760 RepID=UPI00339134EA
MTDVTAPERPILVTIPNVELIKAGSWEISTGTWNPTTEDLYAAVAALSSPAIRRPTLKLGHTDPRFDGEPTIGYIDNLRVEDNGTTLVGDYCGMPGWLGDIMASAYPDRSIEGRHNFTDQTGRTHPFVLEAVALLGVTAPGVGTLGSIIDVAKLYGVAATSSGKESFTMPVSKDGSPHASAVVVAASVTVADLQSSFYNGPAADSWWWIEDIFLEPPEVVAINDEDGTLHRVPFAVEGEEVTWGESQEVKREYVAASSGLRKPLAHWDSKETSRAAAPGTSVSDTSGTETSETEGGSTVAFTDEQIKELREALDLPETATDQELFDALLEKATAPDTSDPETDPATDTGVAASISKLTEVAKANGLVLVEASGYEQTRTMAARGAQALDRQESADREKLVSEAIHAGKIPTARKSHWLKALEADPEGVAASLAALEPGLIPVSEVGHGVNASAETAELGWFGATTKNGA